MTMTVLVVDDDAGMRAMLTDVLTRRRMRVVADSNGTDALARLEATPIDAVVLDKEMPGIGGFDTLAEVRRGHPGLPVIIITAFGGRRVADDAFARGASGYLEKPFRVHELIELLHAISAH